MDFTTYQEGTARTGRAWDPMERVSHTMLLGLGLAGEAGEVAELIKKWAGHGAPLDRERLTEEVGDTLWYLSEVSRVAGISLAEAAEANLRKLEARYPDGFKEGVSVGAYKPDIIRMARFLLDLGYGLDFGSRGARPPTAVLEAMVWLCAGELAKEYNFTPGDEEEAYYVISAEVGDWRTEAELDDD